jgi:hypothetical protein
MCQLAYPHSCEEGGRGDWREAGESNERVEEGDNLNRSDDPHAHASTYRGASAGTVIRLLYGLTGCRRRRHSMVKQNSSRRNLASCRGNGP